MYVLEEMQNVVMTKGVHGQIDIKSLGTLDI